MPATHRTVGTVEDYTNAFLVVCGLMTFMALLTIAATKGTVWMLFTALCIECLIRLSAAFRASREVGKDC